MGGRGSTKASSKAGAKAVAASPATSAKPTRLLNVPSPYGATKYGAFKVERKDGTREYEKATNFVIGNKLTMAQQQEKYLKANTMRKDVESAMLSKYPESLKPRGNIDLANNTLTVYRGLTPAEKRSRPLATTARDTYHIEYKFNVRTTVAPNGRKKSQRVIYDSLRITYSGNTFF